MEEHVKNEKHERLIEALTIAGSAWARYGLTVGRAALETAARSLEATAGALGTLADAFGSPERKRDDSTPAAPPEG